MAELKNLFSWSKTRNDTFRRCPRQYFFQYYGSWGGWKSESDDRTKKIYVLKQLQSRQMWAGRKVHDGIQQALSSLKQGLEPTPEDQAIETTLAVMRKDFTASRRGEYWTQPKRGGFFEHEYRLAVGDEDWRATAEHVVGCLKSFFAAPIYQEIKTLPSERWLETEEFSSFILEVHGSPESVKVHVVLDFSYRDPDRGVTIYDWKTGRSTAGDNALQLACYALYATRRWNVLPDQVTTNEFNLATGETTSRAFRDSELEATKQRISASIREMWILLDDFAANRTSEERFAFTTHNAVCRRCNYLKVCPKWQDSSKGETPWNDQPAAS